MVIVNTTKVRTDPVQDYLLLPFCVNVTKGLPGQRLWRLISKTLLPMTRFITRTMKDTVRPFR